MFGPLRTTGAFFPKDWPSDHMSVVVDLDLAFRLGGQRVPAEKEEYVVVAQPEAQCPTVNSS